MSHTTSVSTELRDELSIHAACAALGLPEPVRGEHELFDAKHEGLGVALRDWRYPLIVNTDDGTVKYDTYNGQWGNIAQLDEFIQRYAIEKVLRTAQAHGHTTEEHRQSDGSVKVLVNMLG